MPDTGDPRLYSAPARFPLCGTMVCVLPSFSPGVDTLAQTISAQNPMLKNYLKVALRNLRQQKGYSFINIAGLALGIACCLLIGLYISNELRYERHHTKADRIFRVTQMDLDGRHWAATAPLLAPAMKAAIPEIEAVARFYPINTTLRYENRLFNEPHGVYADSVVFDVFTFPLLRGDSRTALVAPQSVVLTTSMAGKYFGSVDPLGKSLEMGNGWTLTVTGIIADPPQTTHLPFDYMVSFQSLYGEGDWEDDDRTWSGLYSYILLRSPKDLAQVEEKLPAFADSFYAEFSGGPASVERQLIFQPLRDIYLHSQLEKEYRPNGSITHIYVFSIIATFILAIACINFVNLSTARATERIREVGIRKAVGAHRIQLVVQFLSESLLIGFCSLILAGFLVTILLPVLNHFTGESNVLAGLAQPFMLLIWLILALAVGLIAGGYPSLVLSGFRPTQALRGHVDRQGRSGRLRKALVVFQFAISICLLIGTGIVFNQLQYSRNMRLGFDKERVLKVQLTNYQHYVIRNSRETLRHELRRHPSIEAVSFTSDTPGERYALGDITVAGMSDPVQIRYANGVDHDYLRTLGIELAAGRDFSYAAPADTNAWIINQAAVPHLALEDPIGRVVQLDGYAGPIVGVARDFHFASLHSSIEPLAIRLQPGAGGTLLLRTSGSVDEALDHTRAVLDRFTPGDLFQYSFLDEDFDSLYRAEARLSELLGYFSGIAIFIACLGLFGLASFSTARRTKEIGVRKVLGASVSSIVGLLSKDFLKLIGIAVAIAVPLAYFTMHRWLEDFAYRIQIRPGVFLLAGTLAIVIALATVSYQSLRAALADPVKSLRFE